MVQYSQATCWQQLEQLMDQQQKSGTYNYYIFGYIGSCQYYFEFAPIGTTNDNNTLAQLLARIEAVPCDSTLSVWHSTLDNCGGYDPPVPIRQDMGRTIRGGPAHKIKA